MKAINYSTKKGKELYARTFGYRGTTLSDVYKTYSYEKEKAYKRCRDMFMLTDMSDNFAIVSANSFSFACAWDGKDHNGERICCYITKDNDYIIYMDR